MKLNKRVLVRWSLLLVVLGAMFTAMGLTWWTTQLEPDLINAEAPSDDGSYLPKRPPRPIIPVRQLLQNGRLLLYTFRGEPVYWEDLTGVRFALVVDRAKQLDKSMPESERKQFSEGSSFAPGKPIVPKPGDSVADLWINGVIESFVEQAILYEAYRRFAADHSIDLSKRFDLGLFYRNVNEHARILHHVRRARSEAHLAPQRLKEIYDNSPVLQSMSLDVWKQRVSFAGNYWHLSDFQNAVCPRFSVELDRVTPYRRRQADLYLFHFALMDHIRRNRSRFGRCVEERHGQRDAVVFHNYRLKNRRKVASLLESFTKADGRIDLNKASRYHRQKEIIGFWIWDVTNYDPFEESESINASLKSIDILQFMHPQAEIVPGQLVRFAPITAEPNRFGFIYLGKKIVKPHFQDYDPFSNETVRQFGFRTVLTEAFEKIRRDFVFHKNFEMTALDVLRATGSELSYCVPRVSYNRRFERAIKHTKAEREYLEQYFQEAKKAFGTAKVWPEFEAAWKRKEYSCTWMLDRYIEKSGVQTPPAFDAAAANLRRVPTG